MNRESQSSPSKTLLWIQVAVFVYVLLVGVGLIGEGFNLASGGSEGAAKIFAFASNPVVGVILGTLCTALVQSSSTVTSVIVGLVAGGVPVSIAVPMIMGANMGTSITNTIVSLGFLKDRASFKKSFQAATVHDFFNLFSILIFLPLEVIFHPLERIAGMMSGGFAGAGGASIKSFNIVGNATKPVSNFIVELLEPLAFAAPYVAIGLGIGCVVISVLLLGKALRATLTGKAKGVLESAVGKSPLRGVASGTVVTVLVQSSSTTTSLVVPLAGSGVLTLRQVFPFTMGANIGTCITSLLAATSVGGAHELFALQIALVHLLYNVFGVTLFLCIPGLKELPIRLAEFLGAQTEKNRGWALAYIFGVFFFLPGVVLGAQYLSDQSRAEAENGQGAPAIENAAE